MDVSTVERVLAAVRDRAGQWRQTAIEQTWEAGNDPFAVLVATIMSARTKDETTLPAARRLLAEAPDPPALAALPDQRIAELIYPVGFYRTKARALRRMAGRLEEEHGGAVPADLDALVELPGVGRKTANLVVSRAFGLPGICVDTHVHRIMNRLGFVETQTPFQTEMALRERLPAHWWLDVNSLLVAFGQNVCHPTSPWCSRCPVAGSCEQNRVERRR